MRTGAGAAPPPALVDIRGFPLAGGGTLDLEVRPGEVVLVNGPNGCGKTTLLRWLAGLPVPHWPVPEGGRQGALAEGATVHLALQDPRDNLVGLTVAGEFRMRGLRALPKRLGPLAERDVATLSSGEARRTSLGVATGEAARVLLLDEPAEGLDAEGQGWLAALVADARREGCVVAVDHSGALAALATRRIDLGATATPRAPHTRSTASGRFAVEAPAVAVRRGAETLRLPKVSAGPGLHAVVGPNGSGKSTLLLRLAGLVSSDGVLVEGRPPKPGRTVRLLLPRARDLLAKPSVRAEMAAVEEPFLGFVPEALLSRHPLTVSGGQAQRVALAKTLGRTAPLYLLDEPEAHLDADGWGLLWAALERRLAEGACILAATHDGSLVAAADSVIRVEGAS